LERAANQPSRAPTTAPIASREPARIGSRFNFEAVPWAVCLAPALAALRATVLFNEVVMEPVYPQRAEVDLIRGLAIASIAGQGEDRVEGVLRVKDTLRHGKVRCDSRWFRFSAHAGG
jgi:hypothetical protein